MAAIDLLAKRARQVAAGLCDEVPSPCVSICRMDPVSELCEGCFRTLDEIALWGRMAEESKREVWRAIGQRIALRQGQVERKTA
ncbi:MAG: DUF1289 domain-containing protein [Ramlibacter sp.]|nr:DUF1289 domain-containing protein [Ramlibacter sp.]